MTWILNSILEIHFVIAVLAGIVSIYMAIPKLQERASHKISLYVFYTAFIVGVAYAVFGKVAATVLIDSGSSQEFLRAIGGETNDSSTIVLKQSVNQFWVYCLHGLLSASFLGLIYFVFQVLSLVVVAKKNKPYRKVSNISIMHIEKIGTPFVFSLWSSSYIFIPSHLISDKNHYQKIIKHEMQHIRNLDTTLIFLLSSLRCLFFINPAVHLVFHNMRNLHELAVDEEVTKTVDKKKYLETLAWVFDKTTIGQHPQLTNSFFGKNYLKEYSMRIKNIKNSSERKANIALILGLLSLSIIAITSVSSATKSNLAVSSASLEAPQEKFKMTIKMNGDQGKPVVMNVVSHLNEDALIVHSSAPDWIKNIEENGPIIEDNKDTSYRKVNLKVTESGSDWVKLRIKGTFKNKEDTKQFDIANTYKTNAVHDIPSIGAQINIQKGI